MSSPSEWTFRQPHLNQRPIDVDPHSALQLRRQEISLAWLGRCLEGTFMSNVNGAATASAGPCFLSVAERDRRHRLIREQMAADDLEVLILPASANRWEQSMADSRYATGIGGFGTETLTVFPRQGDPTVYLFNRAAWWISQPNRWIADVRDGHNHWAQNVIERLREIGFTRGKIGLSGLAGQTRTPDGVIPQRTFESVGAAFPGAALVDATSLILNLRSVKSPEEVAALERAAAITDKMVEAMSVAARPGVTERFVYATLISTMLMEGGELPSLLIFASGDSPALGHGQFVPTDRVLRSGDLIVNEIEARIAGYGSQTVAPLCLRPVDNGYKTAIELALAAFDAVAREMRPGARLVDLTGIYRETLRREGKGKFVSAFPLMHARGLGDEIPTIIDSADLDKNSGAVLAENMTFVVKPRVRTEDGTIQAQIGDTVVVTPSGGRRLGRRPLHLLVVA